MERAALDASLERAAAAFGTPAYVYFTAPIEARVADLREAFGGRFALSYAAKSNPNPALLAWLADRVELLDVSSIGELRLGLRAGWAASRASFTGPGKREFELAEAIGAGIGELVLESPREAMLADRIAAAAGRVQDVLVRIAPARVPKGFGDQMAGRPSAFGIDVEEIATALPPILALPHLRVTGLHIYSGTQCLKAEAICENFRIFLEIFRDVCAAYALAPGKLVFGSGFGVPYHDGDAPLDLAAVARGVEGELDALKREPRFARTRLVLELGRYLVGEAGYFLTRVVAVKPSRGTRIGILDGGMNNHLPASGKFGMVVHRNYAMHKVGGDAGPAEKIDLVGPLCTSIDRLATGAALPRLEEGDLVALHGSGAYGLTASPLHFISHAAPQEILVDAEQMRAVTRDLGDIRRDAGGGGSG
jgi:diaminopimelate decarboxylase